MREGEGSASETYADKGPLVRLALETDVAAMLLDDLPADGKADATPSGFRGVEGLEKIVEGVLAHPCAIIFYSQVGT